MQFPNHRGRPAPIFFVSAAARPRNDCKDGNKRASASGGRPCRPL